MGEDAAVPEILETPRQIEALTAAAAPDISNEEQAALLREQSDAAFLPGRKRSGVQGSRLNREPPGRLAVFLRTSIPPIWSIPRAFLPS
jgi:hypothetical protein